MTRKHIGYIMLAAELIILSVLIVGSLLFDWDINWEEHWALIILLPAAAALIVGFGFRPWNIYPALVSAINSIYWIAYNNAYNAVEYDPNDRYGFVYNSAYYRWSKLIDLGERLWLFYVALAFIIFGVWVILRIVQLSKEKQGNFTLRDIFKRADPREKNIQLEEEQ